MNKALEKISDIADSIFTVLRDIKDKTFDIVAAGLTIFLGLTAISAIPVFKLLILGLGLCIVKFYVTYGWHAFTGVYPPNSWLVAIVVIVTSFTTSKIEEGQTKTFSTLIQIVATVFLIFGVYDYFFGTVFGK